MWLGLLFAVTVAVSGPALADVRLATNVSPSRSSSGVPVGGSIAHEECIFQRLDIPYKIQSMPWRRASQEVHAGELEALYTAMMLDCAIDWSLLVPLVL